jgi:hypothetical protein
MKQLLLTASACIGLFAFTKTGVSRNHLATVKDGYTIADTSHKPKPDSIGVVAYSQTNQMDTSHKPKPDSIGVLAYLQTNQNDTTHKPKPDSVQSIALFRAALADTTHKPKPDSMMLVMR